jgi:hypothetical protein
MFALHSLTRFYGLVVKKKGESLRDFEKNEKQQDYYGRFKNYSYLCSPIAIIQM